MTNRKQRKVKTPAGDAPSSPSMSQPRYHQSKRLRKPLHQSKMKQKLRRQKPQLITEKLESRMSFSFSMTMSCLTQMTKSQMLANWSQSLTCKEATIAPKNRMLLSSVISVVDARLASGAPKSTHQKRECRETRQNRCLLQRRMVWLFFLELTVIHRSDILRCASSMDAFSWTSETSAYISEATRFAFTWSNLKCLVDPFLSGPTTQIYHIRPLKIWITIFYDALDKFSLLSIIQLILLNHYSCLELYELHLLHFITTLFYYKIFQIKQF